MGLRGPKKGEGGRNEIPFDVEQFEECCHIQCTETEIAAVLKMSVDTLQRRVQEHYGQTFADVFALKREGGKQSLRRKMWQKATGEKDDTIMQLFLSKNYLGMKDKAEVDISGEFKITLEGIEPDTIRGK